MHRAGVKHQAADALSRLPTTGADTTTLEDDLPLMAVQKMDSGASAVHFIDAQEGDATPAVTIIANAPKALTKHVDDKPSSIQEFLMEQAQDPYCKIAAKSVGLPNSEYRIDQHGLLVRRSMIGGSIQTAVPQSLRSRVLYLSHHTPIAGHPGQRRMRD